MKLRSVTDPPRVDCPVCPWFRTGPDADVLLAALQAHTCQAPAVTAFAHRFVSDACQHGLHNQCPRTCVYCGAACECTACAHPHPNGAGAP